MLDLRDNCLLQYGFNDDDETSQVRDTSGNDNHGTFTGPTEDNSVTGKVDKSLSFDGSAEHITIGSPVVLSGFWSLTVGVYLNDNIYTPRTIIESNLAYKGCIFIREDSSGSIRAVTFYNDSGASVSWTEADGVPVLYHRWRQLTFISQSGGEILQLFINNVWKGNKTINTTFTANAVAKNGSNFPKFKGYLDCLNIFDRDLSETERNYLYNGGDWTERLFERPIKVYRGQDGNIDYETVVAEMDVDDTQVTIAAQNLPPNTIWDYVRRQFSFCDLASEDSPVCTIVIDEDGEMSLAAPNPPVSLTIEKVAGAKMQLRWRYTPIGEEISPTGFKIYMDSGGGFDFETPEDTVAYSQGRSGEHTWISGTLSHGQTYRFTVRSYRTGAGESANTDFVAAAADSQGPAAITGLAASWEEI